MNRILTASLLILTSVTFHQNLTAQQRHSSKQPFGKCNLRTVTSKVAAAKAHPRIATARERKSQSRDLQSFTQWLHSHKKWRAITLHAASKLN